MPGRNGTGPLGQGPMAGKSRQGRGRMGGRSAGPGGFCVCPSCGEKTPHQAGVPCFEKTCLKCGARMVRE